VLRDKYPDLYQFLAGRFNQDWDLFGSDDEAVIDGFLHEEPREFVDAVRRQIRALMELRLPESELQEAVWGDLGCEYDPTSYGLSMTQWLQAVASRLDRGRKLVK
jgi:hypothetical protein